LVIAMFGAALGALIAGGGPAIALLVPTWVGWFGLAALVRFLVPDDPEVARRILRWTVAGFFTHLLLGLVISYGGAFIQKYLGAPDANAYHVNAVLLVRHWTDAFPTPDLPAGKEGFYYLLAALYRVLGPHRVAGLAVNALLSAALVPLMYDTTRRLFGSEAARYAPPLIVLVPNLLIFSSQLLKEAAILFLIAVIINCTTRLSERFSVVSLVILGSGVCLLLTFRAWVALVLLAGVLGSVGFARRDFIAGFGAGVSAVVVVAAVLAFGLGYSGYRTASKANLREAQAVRESTSVGVGSGFDAEADVSNPVAALSYLPRGLLAFMLGPFPWQIGRATQLAVVPDLLVWWFLLPSLWRGVRQGGSLVGRRILVVVLPAFAVSSLLALSVGNFGTVVRERAQPLLILVPVVALGWAVRARREPPGEGQLGAPEPVADVGRQRSPV
jgi:hypothetical protein